MITDHQIRLDGQTAQSLSALAQIGGPNASLGAWLTMSARGRPYRDLGFELASYAAGANVRFVPITQLLEGI